MEIRLLNKDKEPITNWLIVLNNKDLLCDNLDQIDFIPIGGIIDCKKFDFGNNIYCEDSYLINIKDFNRKRIINDGYSGCCGNSGDMLNIYDENDNEIGYEFGDCYMHHYVEIPKKNITTETRKNKAEMTLFAVSKYENENYLIDRIIGTDKQEITRKLDKQVKRRLKDEISKDKILKIFKENIKYIGIIEFKTKYIKDKKIEDVCLFTKYSGQSNILSRYK